MKLNDFEVVIPEGDETEVGYVCLMHGTQYSIKLRNHSERLRCNATVKIDGRSVGTWRVDRREAITIERPVHDSGRFTFYQEGTPEAAEANIRSTDELGLISVLFRPEKSKDGPLVQYMAAPRPYAAGGTGLSGKSAQQFDEAEEIEIDDEKAATIHLRLVAIQNEPRPLFPLKTSVPPAMHTEVEGPKNGNAELNLELLENNPSNVNWGTRFLWFIATLIGTIFVGAGLPRLVYLIWLAILAWHLGRGTSLNGYKYFWQMFTAGMLVSGLCGSFEMLFREAKTPEIVSHGFVVGFAGMIIISIPWCLLWWGIARPFRKKPPQPCR